MGAELGATCSIFPFDQNASEYLRKTGREEIASLAQMNAAELRADDEVLADPSAFYDQIVEIDLSKVDLILTVRSLQMQPHQSLI